MTKRSFIRHIVFFNAKDKTDLPTILEGLNRLSGIPNARNFEVCENIHSDSLSNEVDVVVYAEFADQAALDAYKAHPLYEESISIVRPLRELRIAADI